MHNQVNEPYAMPLGAFAAQKEKGEALQLLLLIVI